jgi:hypothetical protein
MDALERFGDSVKINSKFGHAFASKTAGSAGGTRIASSETM